MQIVSSIAYEQGDVLTSLDVPHIVLTLQNTQSDAMITADMKQLMDQLRNRDDMIELLDEANHLMASLRDKVRKADPGSAPKLIIPKEFKIIAPLVTTYYEDYHGWYEFLRTLRDESGWATKDVLWRKVHQRMRDAHSNYSQNSRRTLAGLAADLLDQKQPFKRGQRSIYMKHVQNVWTQERTQIENKLRMQHPGEHLPNDLRQDVIENFWETTRAKIERGEIPPPPEGFDD